MSPRYRSIPASWCADVRRCTGYGRIATLGKEVVDPRRTIPLAIVATLVVSTVIYVTVAVVAVGSIGSMELSQATATQVAPLKVAAAHFALPVSGLVSVGAMAAMLGVLLNLLPGLSRMLLAMSRRADMPRCVSKVYVAVVVVGVARKRPRNLILQRVQRADQPSELP